MALVIPQMGIDKFTAVSMFVAVFLNKQEYLLRLNKVCCRRSWALGVGEYNVLVVSPACELCVSVAECCSARWSGKSTDDICVQVPYRTDASSAKPGCPYSCSAFHIHTHAFLLLKHTRNPLLCTPHLH